MEGKSKRLFPFEKDLIMNNQTKKFKVHTNEMSNNMEDIFVSEHNFTRHSQMLFSDTNKESVSLVEKMKPMNIAAYVGQKQVIGPDTVLSYLLKKGEIPSMIFWGPPGCGKTSLTNIIAHLGMKMMGSNIHIINLSASSSGVKNVKDAVTVATDKSKIGCKTIVFMDEIHCFNKLQQDIFLPHIEAGTFTLIGSTTENPFYSLNPALLSRCRVFVLHKLRECDIIEILYKAIKCIKGSILDTQNINTHQIKLSSISNLDFYIDNKAIQWLAEACDGDARVALNTLELAVLARKPERLKASYNNDVTITLQDIKDNIIKAHVLSEKETNQTHHLYSALHKSIRAGKSNASLYWMARIMAVKEDPVNIARRLIRISSEDIGLADPDALGIAVHTMYACQMIGMPECDVLLGQCTVYLAKAPKSRLIYNALKAAEKVILEHEGLQPAIPLHMKCNSAEEKHKSSNDTRNLLNQESCNKSCLPEELQYTNFF